MTARRSASDDATGSGHGSDDAVARARAIDDAMTRKIAALERELEARNEQLDGELADATARLEGVLSAVRRIARELAKTREDAERELG
jgi:hypothetical protein